MNHSEVFSVAMHINSAVLHERMRKLKSRQEHTSLQSNLSEVSCC